MDATRARHKKLMEHIKMNLILHTFPRSCDPNTGKLLTEDNFEHSNVAGSYVVHDDDRQKRTFIIEWTMMISWRRRINCRSQYVDLTAADM